MPDEIKCARCGQKRAPLGYSPLPTELGQKIASDVCQPCWSEWLQTQTRIINHYGLDLTNPEAQGFLLDNMKGFFYGATELARSEEHTSELQSHSDLVCRFLLEKKK